MAIDPRLKEIVRSFVVEAGEHCETVARVVLELEAGRASGAPANAAYDTAARLLHTLKGSAGTLGLSDLEAIAHALEDVLSASRTRSSQLAPEATDCVLKGLDAYMERLRAHAADQSESLPPVDALIESLVARAMGRTLMDSAVETPGGGKSEGAWRVDDTHVTALMREVERLHELRLRLIERHRDSTRAAAALAPLGRAGIAARTELAALSRAAGVDADEATDLAEELEAVIRGLCTQPAAAIIDPLARIVRDHCRAAEKEATFSTVGTEVAVDRRLLEGLRGPLVHLVRNAVDHGIETVDVRTRRGKHRAGSIVVRVEQQGGMLLLEVSDDGNGIDVDRVRDVALERGLANNDELHSMDARALIRLILTPGFTTRRQATTTSGRGYGMDAVRVAVEALQGRIEFESIAAQGTRVLLMLPLQLGSWPVMLVRCEEQEIGLPLHSVQSVLATRQQSIGVGHSPRLVHEDRVFVLSDVGGLLRVREPRAPVPGQPLLLLDAAPPIALAVDQVIGHAELVVRPLPHELGPMPAYLGVAAVASGQLVPVLSPTWLCRAGVELADGDKSKPERKALVVDDSLTARSMHRAMLEAGGYVVHAVPGATQALRQLEHANYDVMVCDVAMEGMDGFELTRVLREKRETRSLPIVLVSAYDAETERVRGLDAGADAFIAKRECEAGRLLAEVGAAILRRKGSS